MDSPLISAGQKLLADIQKLKVNFRLDDGSVQQISVADIEKQPFLAMGRHHGLIRDVSRINAIDLISRLRIRDSFTYMFKHGPAERMAFTPENVQLMKDLGKSMLDLTLTVESEKADPQVNDSVIDSGYTYFGQFVDHDITRDDTSQFEPLQDANKIPNLRTPNLDLDAIYGQGPALSSHLYAGIKLRTGPVFTGGFNNINDSGMITDLPRDREGKSPLAGDNRNDENLIVQHLHLGFLCYHNAVVDALKLENPGLSDASLFANAQREVRRHYQWVVLNDFLRTICGDATVDDVLQNGVKFFNNPVNFFTGAIRMPVEFSVASYRFGHSMIRDVYNFNKNFPKRKFSFAFLFTGQGGNTSGTGDGDQKGQLHAAWRINWNRFFSTANHQAENKARKTDTRVALHMGQLPGFTDANVNFMAMLSSRNLVRGLALGVPTGQAVAQQMGITPLTETQLKANPFENALLVPSVTPEQQDLHNQTLGILSTNDNALCKQTPLWFYILKEAEVLQQGNQLGPVGGRIVTEVFVRMLKQSRESILNNPAWKPRFGTDANGHLRIIDILGFAGRVPAQDAPEQ